jgi:hypothetical protein
LSYRWGSPGDGTDIWLNQQRVRVTKNLAAALQVIRAEENVASSCFWIDALCINQNDIDERNHQVKRMIDIYRYSNYVFVWLGPDSDSSERALAVIEGIHNKMMDELKKGGKPPYFRYDSLEEESWIALCNLLDRSYWSRVWIVQELAASEETDIIVLWGAHFTRMDQLKFVLETMAISVTRWEATSAKLREAEWKINMPRLLLNRLSLFRLVGKATKARSALLTNTMQATKDSEELNHIRDMVRMVMEHATATDPRDMIYGMMGLFEAKITASITPDYNLSVAHVYAEYTRAIITAHGDLTITYRYGSGDLQQLGWPSWVPDFRNLANQKANTPRPMSEKGLSAGGSSARGPIVRPFHGYHPEFRRAQQGRRSSMSPTPTH